MKKFTACILLLLLVLGVFAQDPIKNFSFENWKTDSNNILVPAEWDYNSEVAKKGAIKKHNSGSQGSSALFLGCYADPNSPGGITSGSVSIRDNITTIPTSLSFDYIVNNNNSFVNALSVEIFFYDDNGFIDDYDAYISQSNATFRSTSIPINKNTIAKATNYLILIQYLNIGGSTTEFGIVDNLKFSTSSGGNTSVKEATISTLNIFPNPTTGIFNYSLEGNEKPSSIIVTSVDGKQSVFEPNFTNSINISTLVSGIYTVSFLNEKNAVIGRNKIVLTK